MDDYKKFCMKCSWNDSDFGCTSRFNEAVYQCPMYMYYHPDEVKEFEKAVETWNATTKDRQIIAPKGTFKKIWEDEEDEEI